jgi:hypothetical protein
LNRMIATPNISKVLRHSRRLLKYGFPPDSVVSAVKTVLSDLRSADVPEHALQPLLAFVARVEERGNPKSPPCAAQTLARAIQREH